MIGLVKLQNAVHDRHVQHDAALNGHSAPHQTAAGAPGYHRNVVLVSVLHDFGDFLGGAHLQKNLREPADAAQLVVAVVFVDVLPGQHILLVHKALEIGDIRLIDCFVRHFYPSIAKC
ncbi:hypothetical protein SDC9_159316 [bioreactor metagenome]|uniref:Uncharacterized protein n=1 Tax=bioreactor metagenome TaxID=1076179 RepID=A0A645FEI4_9ZZZZ